MTLALPAPDTQRIALKVQYFGANFHGWQRQQHHRSVQGVLEQSLQQQLKEPITLHGAGRTDTGVHGSGQVAHFDTTTRIPPEHWGIVLNNRLPHDVAITAAAAVAPDWHARFSAIWRRYRYLILNRDHPDVFLGLFSWHHRGSLCAKAMSDALESLIGSHDLELFRRAGSPRPHSWVTVQDVACRRQGDLIAIEVQSSGFLYRMMRLLVGALACVGRGDISAAEFVQMWQTKDWSPMRNRFSAPPQGLCLIGVGYPSDPFAASCPTGGSLIPAGDTSSPAIALSDWDPPPSYPQSPAIRAESPGCCLKP